MLISIDDEEGVWWNITVKKKLNGDWDVETVVIDE